MDERLRADDAPAPRMIRNAKMDEELQVRGIFNARVVRDGKIVWEDEIKNLVVTAGKNLALDTYLAGSSYTVTGPYMGVINSTNPSIVAGDTMASHAGWTEGSSYSGTRKTAAWSAASAGSKSLSAALSFTFTSSDVISGAFLVYGSGAVATVSDTNGTLYSAGTFTGGNRSVFTNDVLQVSYTASL